MLNNKTIQVMKRISKQASSRSILKNYNVKDGILYMTDGVKLVWTPSDIKDGLYNMDGENVTETAENYPDVLRLIPSDYETEIKIDDVKKLLEFVKACVKVNGWKRSDKSNNNLIMLTDNGLKIESSDIQMIYNLTYFRMIDSIAYYNPFYLIDIIEFISANTSDNVATIKYQSRNRPVVIEATNDTGALLMPVRRYY